MTGYPKRLIEVDLPIKRISEHARTEKTIRHGHISSLHIWWARRPLAACRAAICAALWPDPADDLCPPKFRKEAFLIMSDFARDAMNDRTVRDTLLSEITLGKIMTINKGNSIFNSNNPNAKSVLRNFLLDFIADFSNWDASTNPLFLETSRKLTMIAHESLGGAIDTRPLVVDSFAGGGAIPLEALRIGADAFASDLNPVAVLLNKATLEYIPKYGERLANEVRKWGEWIQKEAEKDLSHFYPKDEDGAIPIAYLWARTIQCEGPGCGAEIPLVGNLWLAKTKNNSVAYAISGDRQNKTVKVDIQEKAKITSQIGTVKRSAVTCPVCGFTTNSISIRNQMTHKRGGTNSARLLAVVTLKPNHQGRSYRKPTDSDLAILSKIQKKYKLIQDEVINSLSTLPDETIPTNQRHRSVGSLWVYGMQSWSDVFTPRQSLALSIFASKIRQLPEVMKQDDPELALAVQTMLGFAFDKQADLLTSLSKWEPVAQCPRLMFVRHALAMLWDFAESVPIGNSSGSWSVVVDGIAKALDSLGHDWRIGTVTQASATSHPLPDDIADVFFTDPPYYDSVAYSDLSDFFYVWLKRTVGNSYPDYFKLVLPPKEEEAIVQHPDSISEKAEYQRKMSEALHEGNRILKPGGIAIVVFAHKSTAGWESLLQALMNAGWCITASWPVDTELSYRVHAHGYAALASSVHLVCRPREIFDDHLHNDNIGDWRDILNELPKRIHEWMPRLAQEGVVGADAIFACLGPALEIFSRYSSVEKTSGEKVELKEYLEQVWAAVGREALNMIFHGADASGFEEDARLTAMWLWTMRAPDNNENVLETTRNQELEEDDGNIKSTMNGYGLEYDAARKIAQGLGAHLEALSHLIEVKGETATLLTVGARTRYLFGKEASETSRPKNKNTEHQLTFDFSQELENLEEAAGSLPGNLSVSPGTTVLDQLHQSMILFGAGRSEALKRFLVDDNIGRNQLFWRLAQALSALYPVSSEEKRWVDGVLARKKGLGL